MRATQRRPKLRRECRAKDQPGLGEAETAVENLAAAPGGATLESEGKMCAEVWRVSAEVPQYALEDEVCIDPAKTALVVIDMQNDYVKQGGSLLVPDAEATIPAIGRLLALARASRMRVVYSQDSHHRGDPEWEIWPEHCREGSWGWEIIQELAPRIDETVLRKVRPDAFYDTPLDHLLRLWTVDTLLICGTLANIGVQYTAASAALRWYAVVIPRDAVSALEPFDLEALLRQTAFVFGGRVTTAARVSML